MKSEKSLPAGCSALTSACMLECCRKMHLCADGPDSKHDKWAHTGGKVVGWCLDQVQVHVDDEVESEPAIVHADGGENDRTCSVGCIPSKASSAGDPERMRIRADSKGDSARVKVMPRGILKLAAPDAAGSCARDAKVHQAPGATQPTITASPMKIQQQCDRAGADEDAQRRRGAAAAGVAKPCFEFAQTGHCRRGGLVLLPVCYATCNVPRIHAQSSPWAQAFSVARVCNSHTHTCTRTHTHMHGLIFIHSRRLSISTRIA